MVSVQIAALVLAVSGPSDTVLLDFQATWCAPCRAMEGTVAQLQRAGYPVRKVDIDHERALADRFNVQSVPSFVLLVDGREVSRVTGAVRRNRLVAMFKNAGVEPHGRSSSIARAQSPDSYTPGSTRTIETAHNEPATAVLPSPSHEPTGPSAYDNPAPNGGQSTTRQQLVRASVRLKIEDATGSSYGTGTLIDARQGEALILTCGHIFRESQGKGTILVDMLGPDDPKQLPGRLVGYDLKRDLGLVSIRPGVPVHVAPVAPKGRAIAQGDAVITVGCNNGGPPTAIDSQINSKNKFLGPPNLQVAGLPVEGRSGGGLFTTDGHVIGVCNAADPADNEGLYAALESIHSHLDGSGLTAVYAARPSPSVLVAMPETSEAESMAHATANAALMTAREQATLAELRGQGDGAEVICIVRSLDDTNAPSEVIRLDRASPEFLRQLAADREAQSARHLTSLQVPAARQPASGRQRALPAGGVRWSSSSTEPTDRVLR